MTDLSGTVLAVANGFAAVEIPRGYVVLELMGPEAEVGDEVVGIQFEHSGQRVQVRGRELSVRVRALDATWDAVRELLGI
jgi:hypothetical protein